MLAGRAMLVLQPAALLEGRWRGGPPRVAFGLEYLISPVKINRGAIAA